MASSTVTVRITGDSTGLSSALGRAEGQLASFGDRVGAVGRRMQGIGRQMTTMVTLPIVGAGAAAGKLALDFEQSMSKITGLVGISAKNVDKMRDSVLRLAKDTGQAPQELADGLFFITSAGLRGADALEALRIAARGSAAGLGETAVIADAMTSAINAYGAENLSAAQAGDVLTAAVRAGKVEASDLAPVFGGLLPLSSQLGVEFDEVAAGLAYLTRSSGDASLSATGLRGIFSKLIKPTQAGAAELEKLGLSTDGLRQMVAEKGLLPALQELRARFGDNTEAAGKFFEDIDGLNAFLSITGDTTGQVDAVFKDLADSTGSLDAAFKAAADTGALKFDKMLAALKVAAIQLGEKLLPIAIKLGNAFSGLVDAFSGLSPTVQDVILAVLGLAAVAGPLVYVIGSLAVVIGAILSPVGLVIVGIVALAAAAVYAYTRFEGFRNVVDAVAGWLTGVAAPAIADFARGVADQIGRLVGWWKEHWAQIKEAVQNVVTVIKGIITPFIAAIVLAWRTFGDELLAVARAIWTYISLTVQNAVNFIRNVIELFLNLLTLRWGDAWNSLLGILSAVWAQIQTLLNLWLSLVMAAIEGALSAIRAVWDAAWNAIAAVLTGAWERIKSLVSSGMAAVVGLVSGAMSTLAGAVSAGIGSAVSWFAGLPGRVAGAVSSLPGILAGIGTNALIAFVGALLDVPGRLGGFAGRVADALSGAVGAAASAGAKAAAAFVGGIVDGILSGADRILGVAKRVGGWLNPFGSPHVVAWYAGSSAAANFAAGLIRELPRHQAAIEAAVKHAIPPALMGSPLGTKIAGVATAATSPGTDTERLERLTEAMLGVLQEQTRLLQGSRFASGRFLDGRTAA